MDSINISVDVVGSLGNGYRLKVLIPEIGIYINGFTARPSSKDEGTWWIQPPSIKTARGNWINVVEFDKNLELWQMIEFTAIESVDKHLKANLLDISTEPDFGE